MFNLGSGEIALIAVAALLILGPSRLPELARGIGKFMREFRRQTDEVRGVVEREFYKMDAELQKDPTQTTQTQQQSDSVQVKPAQDTLAQGQHPDELPPPPEHMSSQLTAGMPPSTPAPEAKTEPAPPAPAENPSDKS